MFKFFLLIRRALLLCMALFVWKCDVNGEVNIIGYERIIHGQSWVVGSGVEAQGVANLVECGFKSNLATLLLFLIGNQGW